MILLMAPPKGFVPWNKGIKTGPWAEETKRKASLSHMGNTGRLGQKIPPEEIAKRVAKLKGKKKPAWFGEKISKSLKGRIFSTEWKQKISDAKSGKPNLKLKGRFVSEETRSKISLAKTGVPNSKLKGRPKSPEHIEKMKLNAQNRSPEHCKKISASKIGKNTGEKCYLWKGGISFEPYCKKFSRVRKEQVRWFFNQKCAYCGKTNKKRLNVHHVSYDKQVGCNGAPMLLVPLCDTCHAVTNFDREYWEQYFMELLYIQYGGKCCLSVDELKQRIREHKQEVKV